MIPPHAQCVFRGEIFDVYQWPQKMYDGSVKTFEALRRPDTVEVLAVVGEKIILLKQEQPDRPDPFLCLPGGRVDTGEAPLPAAERELREEAGYVSHNWELYRAWQPHHKIEWTCYVFIAHDCRSVGAQCLDAGERIEVQLVAFDEFLSSATSHDFRNTDFKVDLYRAALDPAFRAALSLRLF